MGVRVERFFKRALQLKNAASDIKGQTHSVCVALAPFRATECIDNARYVPGSDQSM